MITVKVSDNTQLSDTNKLIGDIVYEYWAPTHWSDLCRVVVRFSAYAEPEIRLSYGAGGWAKDATDLEVAEAMAEAFTLAAQRLQKQEVVHGNLILDGEQA